ncbi:MAG: chorismate mutase [Clostridiales bacterium]|nr:chorismate mutase [Clostridiales bacterium]MCD8109860.1 chorismate mutase [Clostridiales bacterium]MCD8133957.1 chorismate mutase [Clostridiales bacterium]
MKDLKDIRDDIDRIDRQIVDLYEKRMDLATQVADYKISTGKQVFDAEREIAKLNAVAQMAHSDFTSHGARELFEHIMSMSRKKQYQLLTEYGKFAPTGFVEIRELDFSHAAAAYIETSAAAAREYFSKAAEVSWAAWEYPAESERRCDTAAQGESPLTAERKDAVDSDRQDTQTRGCGLLLCENWREACEVLKKGEVNYLFLPVQDPASGYVSANYNLIAEYGFYILEEYWTSPEPQDCYVLISKDKLSLSGADKISICFEAPDTCGSLYHLMSHLTYNNLNMNRIESIVISREPLDYRFFMNISGNLNDSPIKNAILGLRDEARNFKILGNYR